MLRIKEEKIIEFVNPFYAEKDIMHNMWHINLVRKKLCEILTRTDYTVNQEFLILAMYFHGFIYSDEEIIRRWLTENGYKATEIEKIVQIAWESQRSEVPETLEGKLLHDAHVLEGGKTYAVVKTLITGSVRGQTLEETLSFMKSHVLGKNVCYLPETVRLCEEMNAFTDQFYHDIITEIT